MKKQLLSIFAIAATSGSLLAQLPASTTPANKNALLEEYTGVHCGYCPDGHKIADQIKAANPTKVVLVNVHTGGFSVPGPNQPTLVCQDGNNMNTVFGVTSFPQGLVNRAVYSGATKLNRTSWSAACNSIIAQPAYVNVAVQGTLDVQTRVLQVEAQAYYTGNGSSTNKITVMVLENDVRGYQSDYGAGTGYNPTNWHQDYGGKTYKHNHVLRKSLTAALGDNISTTTSGTTYNTGILTYTVPSVFGTGSYTNVCELGNLELAVFVAETDYNVINAANGPITLTNIPNAVDAQPYLKGDHAVCTGNMEFAFKFFNHGSTPITNAVFTYSANGGTPLTHTFTGNVKPQTSSAPIQLPNLNITPMPTNTLSLEVVSVNGGTDDNSANDKAINSSIAFAPMATSPNFTMDFYQDRWGADTYWRIDDEATSTYITGDGPWTNLSANGTQLRQKTFTITPQNTCYKLTIFDADGDGISGGWGGGNFQLKSGSSTIINHGATNYFTYKKYYWFKTATDLGLAGAALNVEGVSIYPNPANTNANLSIDLTQNENVNLVVLNNLGQVVSAQNLQLQSGSNTVNLNTENWAAGIYNIKLSTPNGTVTKKLTVAK